MGSKRIDTTLIHAGQPRIAGAVEMPIFQSAMFEYTGETSYHDLGYIRLNNTPNHKALHTKLAAHTLCIYLNRLLGVPDCLQIKALAFN